VPRLSPLTPRDEREKAVISVWRSGGLGLGTIAAYLGWVRRWRTYWAGKRVDDVHHLTLSEVSRFLSSLIGPRHGRRVSRASRALAANSLHGWWCALEKLGASVPCWRPTRPTSPLPVLLQAYVDHRRAYRGVAPGTLKHDVDVASAFLAALKARHHTISTIQIADIDAFVDGMIDRWAPATVAGRCSSLRAFLRFLRATGRLHRDLATAVVGARIRVSARPPRALPWSDIRRILRAIPHRRKSDLRDHAMLILLASYGMGCSEVAGLRLDDIDWAAKILRVRRQKTDTPMELPLLPQVAYALAAYLRRARPSHSTARQVFLTIGMPHRPITAAAVRHQVRKHASVAGVHEQFRGAHVFRHSYATRQIDLGARPKILSDILGHRRPSSTSIYVRVAIRRLRTLALPVPR
jgi:integrase/recombinase XerD